MSQAITKPFSGVAREADRLYGELLILLGLLSAAAPLFVESTLAWALLLAGVAGVWWMALDRTPRGMVAGAAWTLITLGLGLHLSFHILLDVLPLEMTLALGFILLGVAELALGIERGSRRRLSRPILVLGGGVAIVFGISVPIVWPDIPAWTGPATVSIMFITFGAGLLIGRKRARSAGS
jgi:uncharacterized membrane protein HdeD (DUF308 family)